MIKIKLKTILDIAKLVGNREQIISMEDNSTVLELLIKVLALYGEDLKNRLFNDSNELKKEILIFLNGRDITLFEGLDTVLSNEDEVFIFPPVGGG